MNSEWYAIWMVRNYTTFLLLFMVGLRPVRTWPVYAFLARPSMSVLWFVRPWLACCSSVLLLVRGCDPSILICQWLLSIHPWMWPNQTDLSVTVARPSVAVVHSDWFVSYCGPSVRSCSLSLRAVLQRSLCGTCVVVLWPSEQCCIQSRTQ